MGKLYLVSGNDDYAIKAKTREIAIALCGENPEENPDLEVILGDSEELKPEEILSMLLNALNTPPFLSPEKKIWLRHFLHFEKVLAGNAKEAESSKVSALVDYLKKGLPDDITLIIDGPGLDQRKALFKVCKAVAAPEDIIFFRKADITARDYAKNQYERILELCRKAKKKIDQGAVQYLSETVGSDTGRLQSELNKVVCYIGDSDCITLRDCKAICSRTPEALSWDFAACLVERNVPGALEIINTLMEQMKSERSFGLELSILSSAMRNFQEMVKTKTAIAELNLPRHIGKSCFYSMPPEAKDNFPNNILLSVHPFRAYKMCESSRQFSDHELAGALAQLLEANRRLVSGGGDARIILEQLTIHIAGRSRTR